MSEAVFEERFIKIVEDNGGLFTEKMKRRSISLPQTK